MKLLSPCRQLSLTLLHRAACLCLLATSVAQAQDEFDPLDDPGGLSSEADDTDSPYEDTEEEPADGADPAEANEGDEADGDAEDESASAASDSSEASASLSSDTGGTTTTTTGNTGIPNSHDAPYDPSVFQKKTLWQGLRSDNSRFGIDGTLQMDVGYADYRQDILTEGPEVLHDFRGQFWISPVMEHRFGKNKDAFIRVNADLVAWLREQEDIYQVNVFDIYAQVGIDDIIDLKVGRVTTWRIFDPGSGYDIFTLEDTGAIRQDAFSAEQFYPFRYQVDYIWLRDTPGRAALHLYPLKKFVPEEWNDLGIELTGQYGTDGQSNVDGARAAVIYDNKWIRLAGGAEYETQKFTKDRVAADGTLCEQCTWQYRRGYGGSVVLRPPFLAGGLNLAEAETVDKGADGQEQTTGGRGEIGTRSGYVELHTGHLLASTKNGPRPSWLADQRSENIRQLTIGYGQRRTERLLNNGDFERHNSKAAYIKYNLGFNESAIKAVVTYADGLWLKNRNSAGQRLEWRAREGDMLAGRVRFTYSW